LIKTTPDQATPGTPVTFTASGLAPNAQVSLTWSTSSVSWLLDPRADSVDYTGRQVNKFAVVLQTATTDAQGNLSVKTKVPQDFGGLHDIYAVVNGVQVAKGGLLIVRQFTISPKKGPIGTLIHIHISGLGSSLYESGAGIYYDNKFTGIATANWTRGVAEIAIRAAGPVGQHTIESSSAMEADYLNPDQSPIPWAGLHDATFTVTRDAGAPKAYVEWPTNVSETVPPATTLLAPSQVGSGKVSLSVNRGQVGDNVNVSATGLQPNQTVSLNWGTVVGNRVNCSGQCWSILSVPVATATAAADGTLKTQIAVPDGLGGWHALLLNQGQQTQAQAPFYVLRNFLGASALKVKRGTQITFRFNGLGWTQLDNTAAVDYDNSYIGYGCGFNSNGYVEIKVTATGAIGTHLIDFYPLLYTQNPVYPGAALTYGMVPFLSFKTDDPGLALGYQLPAFHVAIEVVK
jgi:hypothetical protein